MNRWRSPAGDALDKATGGMSGIRRKRWSGTWRNVIAPAGAALWRSVRWKKPIKIAGGMAGAALADKLKQRTEGDYETR